MKRYLLILMFFIICLSTILSGQTTLLQYTYQLSMIGQTSTGVSSGNISTSGTTYHQIIWTVSGTVSTCSVRVDSSADGITWNSGDIIGAQTCTSNGSATSSSFVANFVRINLVTFTGTSPVFNAILDGYSQNPSGGAGAVSSVFGRTGAVVAANNDYSFSQISGTLATNKLTTVEGNGTKVQLTNQGSTINGDVTTYDGSGNILDSGTLLSALALLNSPALTGTPTAPTQSATDNSTRLATTAYVTTGISNAIAAVNPAVAVQAATAAVLPNSPIYNNGVSGIGATLTTATLNTALVVDGYTPLLNDRILVKNQASAFQNGVYTVTQLAGVGVAWILTRALDYDQPSDMNNTGAIPVINGTTNVSTQWLQTSQVTNVGTDAVTFGQFSISPSNLVVNNAANSFTSASTIDLHLGSVTSGFRPPSGAGANPTTDGVLSWDTTNHRLQCGDGTNTRNCIETPLNAGGLHNTVASGVTTFTTINVSNSPNGTENNRDTALTYAGVVRNLCVTTVGTQSATGSLVFTFRNTTTTTDSSLVVTIAAGATAGTVCDTTDTATIVANNEYVLKIVNNATTTSATIAGITSIYRY